MTKPPYKLLTMREINALPFNNYKVVSTFSGAGGTCLGLRMAGYKVVWASEFMEAARQSYSANFPDTPLDARDIRDVTGADILQATGLRVGELDVLEGSPPCASFSMAGKREDKWGKTTSYGAKDVRWQRTDDLFYEYIRLLDELQPKTFIAENVAGLSVGSAIGHLKRFISAMEVSGYNVTVKLIDASRLGVPQRRQRLIFMGVRSDLCTDTIKPRFPVPLPYVYTLADACPWMVRDYVGSKPPIEDKAWFEQYAIHTAWKKLKLGQSSERYFSLVKTHPDLPVPTITAVSTQTGAAGLAHPYEPRKFSLAELRLLSSFPEDFVLMGTFEQAGERIGRSVPPLMAYHVGMSLLQVLRMIDGK